MKTELEFKWSVSKNCDFKTFLSALTETAVIKTPENVLNEDYYIDTNDGALYAKNLVCRIRIYGKKCEFTVKSATKIVNGLANRSEENFPLKYAPSFEECLKNLKANFPFKEINTDTLYCLFSIKNNRTLYSVQLSNSLKTEVAFDDAVISARGKTINFKEIECEFKEGNVSDFGAFTQLLTKKSGLTPSVISKVATAKNMLAAK